MDNRIVFRSLAAPNEKLLTIYPHEFRRLYVPKLCHGNSVKMVYHSSELVVALDSPTGARILMTAIEFFLENTSSFVCTFQPSNYTHTFHDFDVQSDNEHLHKMAHSFYPDTAISNTYCGKDLLPMPTMAGAPHQSSESADHIFVHR